MREKKVLILLFCLQFLLGCTHDPMEKYIGTYNITLVEEYELSSTNNTQTDTLQNRRTGTLSIRPVGDNGEVLLEGDIISTKGYIDKNGHLYIDPEKMFIFQSDETIFNEEHVSIEMNLQLTHHNISNNNALQWKATGTGLFQTYQGSIPLIGGNVIEKISIVATQK